MSQGKHISTFISICPGSEFCGTISSSFFFFYILDANSMPSGLSYEERESPRRLGWLGFAFV